MQRWQNRGNNMYDANDSVGKAVEMSAKLFAIMADEVLKSCGQEKGQEIVKRAVRRYGVMRAEGIKNRILQDGKEVTFETVEEYSDYPANQAWDSDSEINGNTFREVTHKCPFAIGFREVGLEEAGRLYCDAIDLALNETFFGAIDFSRPCIFSDGKDAPCEMVVKLKNEKGE